MKFYTEQAKKIPVIAETDVLVIGGGPAGIGAAIGAARTGAKTMLIEQSNALGGVATSGMMSHWGGGTESPLVDEISRRMLRSNSLPMKFDADIAEWTISHDALKWVLLQMVSESGINLQLYTMTTDVIMQGKQVTGIITESKSGREAIMANVVIDATGDGDIAMHAGAEFILGRDNDNKCQPVTLMFKIAGVDYSKAVFPGSFETYIELPKGEIQALARKHLPHPAGHVLLYRTRFPGEVCVNMTNAINIDGTDVRQLTKGEMICREQIESIVPFLREYVPGYANCYLVATAQYIGVRETRHFKGLYCITENDILEGKIFEDWIAARNHFNFDIHSLKGASLDENGCQKDFHAKDKYTIPYRACIPSEIESLLLAGRNISGTHKAHSSFRIMPICLNIGFGCGIAAAVAVQEKILPRNIDVKKVQGLLRSYNIEP